MNKARRDTELQGMAMRQGAAQFGRSMPTTGIATDAAALNAGNSAAGNLATQAGLHNAGTNAAQNWFGGAAGANSAAGNLALGQYQGQLNAWQQASQNSASSAAGLGNLIGQLGSAYMMKPIALRRGGIIKHADAQRVIRGGGACGPCQRRLIIPEALGLRWRRSSAEDREPLPAIQSLPIAEDVQPIRLSNGEAVLNAGSRETAGEDFIHRVNEAAFMGSQSPGIYEDAIQQTTPSRRGSSSRPTTSGSPGW